MFNYNTVLLEFPLKTQISANKYFVDLSVFFTAFSVVLGLRAAPAAAPVKRFYRRAVYRPPGALRRPQSCGRRGKIFKMRLLLFALSIR